VVWNGSKIPSVFNGNFEQGNMRGGLLSPLQEFIRGDSAPGWSFHQKDFNDLTPANIVSYQLNGSTVLGHAAELSSDGDTELVHNRFYIPTNAQFVQFQYNVREVEWGRDINNQPIVRQPDLDVYVRIGTTEHFIGKLSSTLTTPQLLPGDFVNSPQMSLLSTSPVPKDLRGEVGELVFRLSFSEGQPARASGHARVWIDNVRLGPVGAPLQAESTAQPENTTSPLTVTDLASLLDASRAGWLGMIKMPDGGAGITLGSFGGTTAELTVVNDRNEHEDGDAGVGEGGLNDQLLLTNAHILFVTHDQQAASVGVGAFGSVFNSTAVANQTWGDSDSSLAPHSHPIQSQDESVLSGKLDGTTLAQIIVNHDGAIHTSIRISGAAIGESPIGIANFNVGRDFAAPGSNGAISDLEILKLQELSFPLFKVFPALRREGDGLEHRPTFIGGTSGLSQDEDQQNQSTYQHSLSFGSQTVPPDRNVVNQSEAISSQLFVLSLGQLALLSKATINIGDLPDGYLALTTGTTITLDSDAAGYGWFIDPTPLKNEEFTATATSPWQLTALPDSAAAGHIDLMTVLMHELGHVMGLEHVSSAVDATRLMAASIDPGIRRLPSALDLGMPSAPPSAVSNQQPDPATVWAPYLTHYTVSATGEQVPAPVVNPASLVQAAQVPSHAGILNPNFAISDPQSATFGWDESGAVSIANGQATLSEDSNAISTLSQLFTLPAGSTHLRFTLVDATLSTQPSALSTGPSDAFEVALLEASTLTPLAGVTAGLTQTDSLFNVQQDGTVRFSDRVTLSNGLISGSLLDLTQPVLVDIDLTGITVGAGARLSFDLLGFGDRTSTVTIDNVLLTDGQPTAAPVAVNDSYTVAEGGSALSTQPSGLLANDTDADTASSDLSTLLVTGPTHGTVTLHADGSFTYIHHGSEPLTDAFTYRVSDGINLSNIATVSFTITPTNDAPVLESLAPQTVEQGRTLSFMVTATDPDDSNLAPESTTLTYSLGAGAPAGALIDPNTGLFTWAVPRMQVVGTYSVTVIVTDAGTPALSVSRTFTINVQALTNTPPTLNPIGAKTVQEDTELRFTISATDLDLPAQTLSYSATGLPTGASFNQATREFVWTPAEDQGGVNYQVTFSVTDGEFTASERFVTGLSTMMRYAESFKNARCGLGFLFSLGYNPHS